MTFAPPNRFLTYMITGDGTETSILASVAGALRAGVDLVQIRRKNDPGGPLEALVRRLVETIEGARSRLLVNDRLDVALATGVLGVHLPVKGLPVADVRRGVPEGFRIGSSAHTLKEALHAAESGADFVVFGPVYPTPSKPGHPGLGLEKLRQVVEQVTVPVLALGGVSPERVPELLTSGARGVAGISTFESPNSRDGLLRAIQQERGR